ncbi:hypothetical protein Tco_0291391 [Tanacetum coccineum]
MGRREGLLRGRKTERRDERMEGKRERRGVEGKAWKRKEEGKMEDKGRQKAEGRKGSGEKMELGSEDRWDDQEEGRGMRGGGKGEEWRGRRWGKSGEGVEGGVDERRELEEVGRDGRRGNEKKRERVRRDEWDRGKGGGELKWERREWEMHAKGSGIRGREDWRRGMRR